MRQVDEAELIVGVRFHLARLPAALRKGLASDVIARRKDAEQLATVYLVRNALCRYEVMIDTPLPEGTDLFSRAAYGGATGSAPMIDVEK